VISTIILDANKERSNSLKDLLNGTGSYYATSISAPEVTVNKTLSGSSPVVIIAHDDEQDGIRILKNLREQKIDLPVIIITKVYSHDGFRASVANNAEYMVIEGAVDTWYLVLAQLLDKVSEARKTAEKIEFLNKKLNLVGSVTRHDVLNQLTAVSGYTELLEMMVEDPQMRSFIDKERFALNKIRRQFQFAKDYQNLANEPPKWQLVSSAIRRACDQIALPGISLDDLTGDTLVLADISFDKAIAQIFDNSVRHGERVTKISLSVKEIESGAILIIEDNGVGVPATDKERIFERGFGKYTGWGLYLAKEILAITGLSVAETGTPGNGTRFEIAIPKEAYKKEGASNPAGTT